MTEALSGGLRVNAYVMLADPSFLAQSLAAYYDQIDRLVVCYDEAGRSWTGTALPIDSCLAAVRAIDKDGKCEYLTGSFWRPGHAPLANDTYQRQVALDAASTNTDWVLQLDTDEVMLGPAQFFAALSRADAAGFSGLDYPSRWLYSRVGTGRYLESSSRLWRRAASYPGPLAVRAGVALKLARQTDAPLYRVDLRPQNTDPWRARDSLVHEVVSPAAAVAHFSWVRTPEILRQKFGWSGHAADLKPPAVYRRWVWRSRHPYLAALSSPLRSSDWYRLASIPEPPGGPPHEAV